MAFKAQNFAERLRAAGRSIEDRASEAASTIANNTANSANISVDSVASAVTGATSQITGATVDLANSLNGLTGQSISDTIGNLARGAGQNFISGLVGGIPGIGGTLLSALGLSLNGQGTVANELDQFASYNYIITLSCLTPFEVNFPAFTYRQREPMITICRSGGGPLRGSRISVETGGKTEYFIDNLQIDSIITPTTPTRLTNATGMTFDILEPYSMGNFLQALNVAAVTAGYVNYLEAPYCLTIQFKGWDDFGRPVNARRARRVYPIKFVDVRFTVDEEGSKYSCQAIPYNETALSDQNQSTHTDVQIKGRTVAEILQTGAESLTVMLNNRELALVDAKQNDAANNYIIIFPESSESDGASDFGPVSNNEGATTQTSRSSSSDGMRELNQEDLQELFASITGIENGKLPANFEPGIKNVQGVSVERSQLGEQIREFVEDEENLNDIGKASLVSSNLDGGRQPMSRAGNAESETVPGEVDRCRVQRSNDVRTMSVSTGKRVQDIIEGVIIASEFGRNVVRAEPDENGMVPWFRIDSQVYLAPEQRQEQRTGEVPKIFVYRVLPYKVHRSNFQTPTEVSPGIEQLKRQCVKEYNYIYTGKNKDIVDFDIKFDFAFFTGINGDSGQASSDSKTAGADELASGNTRSTTGRPEGNSEALPQAGRLKSNVPSRNITDIGGLPLFPENIIAMNFNEALINSPTDLFQVDLTIHGDPYFLADSGMGNYSSPSLGGLLNMLSDGSMSYEDSEVDIRLNFRTPLDYGPDGFMEFPGFGAIPVRQFSGVYKVLMCKHSFNQGEFTQTLDMIRRKNQDLETNTPPVDGPGGAVQQAEPENQITPTPEASQGGTQGSSQNGTGGQSTASPSRSSAPRTSPRPQQRPNTNNGFGNAQGGEFDTTNDNNGFGFRRSGEFG